LNADTINWFQADDLSNGFPLDSYRKRFGFRKTVGEHYFYGWMEIYWDGIFVPEGKMIYLDRMAFCTIHDYTLTWGQTTFNESVEEETFENVFSVYPNPTNGAATISVDGVSGKLLVSVVDMSGRVLLSDELWCNNSADCHKQLSVEGLAQGAYYVHIVANDVSLVRKLVVK
jgi:hypothetical protein